MREKGRLQWNDPMVYALIAAQKELLQKFSDPKTQHTVWIEALALWLTELEPMDDDTRASGGGVHELTDPPSVFETLEKLDAAQVTPRNLKWKWGNLRTDMNQHTSMGSNKLEGGGCEVTQVKYAVNLAGPDHQLEMLNFNKPKPAMHKDCTDNEQSEVLGQQDIDTENSRPLSREQGSCTPASSETDPLHVTPSRSVAPTRVANSTSRRMLAPMQLIANRIMEDAYHLGTALVAKRATNSAWEDSSDHKTTSAPTTVSKPARKRRTSDINPLPDAEPIHDGHDKKPVPTLGRSRKLDASGTIEIMLDHLDKTTMDFQEESKHKYALRAQVQLADNELRKDDAVKVYAEAMRKRCERGCEGPQPHPPAF
ncbi:hypothetical protein BDK51DRAFT_39760 [Blyttiomyces helicus]|uniref:Uncharacterized protein n=1 Tax=Blyttiomyces helicus TaxID=388810 RepID=A0A4P9W675_9FUNG|nr:hypothetical protein BDK51DRAFT_39760 [Blyttiomyces helicus]|eukprot:RKO87951.1 hypothetical protein BDK51DRAFT_39760 [Blyttiomyces helicus]